MGIKIVLTWKALPVLPQEIVYLLSKVDTRNLRKIIIIRWGNIEIKKGALNSLAVNIQNGCSKSFSLCWEAQKNSWQSLSIILSTTPFWWHVEIIQTVTGCICSLIHLSSLFIWKAFQLLEDFYSSKIEDWVP